MGAIIKDEPDRPINLQLTVPKCFIRYTPTGDHARLQEWADKIKEWRSKGLQEAYFFIDAIGDGVMVLDELEIFKQIISKE